MLNLVWKDLILQRKTLLFGFVYILIFSFAFSTGGSAMFTAGAFAVTYLLIQTPAAHDDKCHADRMFNSLPVSRAAIVAAKYLSAPLYLLIGSAQYLAVYWLVKLVGIPFTMHPVTLEAFAGLLVVAAVYASVYYPILFRFGYMKTRYLNVGLFALLFATGSALVLAVKNTDGGRLADSISGFLASQPDWLIACGLLGVLLALLLGSWLLSARIYRRREF